MKPYISFILLFYILNISHASTKMAFMLETHSGEKSIWVQSERLQKIETGNSFNIYPFITKDGQELAYVSGNSEKELDIYILNLATQKTEKITSQSRFVLHPNISSNNQFLVYSENYSGKNYIVLFDRKSKEFQKIESDGSLFFPKISSNGSFIIYQKTTPNNKREIWYQSLTSQKIKNLTPQHDKCMSPQLSFDDSQIVMTCFSNNSWNIYTLNLSNLELQQVTHTETLSFSPTFDSENNIIFASFENSFFEFHKLNFNSLKNKYELHNTILSMEGDLYSPSITGNLNYSITQPTQVPSPSRSSFGAIEHKNKIYIFGGHQGREHTYPPESFLNQLDIYDIKKKTWAKGAPRPTVAHGYGVEICGDSIFAFGGFTYSENHKPKWKSLSQIDKYDINKNSWTTIGHLKKPRSSNVVAKVENKIYLIGGWNSTPKHENDYEGDFHRTIEIFNCDTEQIENEILQIPDPLRRAFTGVVHNNKILLLGGISKGAVQFNLLNNVTEFDPVQKSFKELTPLPFATFAPAAGILNNQLHIFGGMYKTSDKTYEYINHTFTYANSWNHTGRYLKDSKGFSSVLKIKDSLWILGGHSYDNNIDEPVPTIEVWKYSN